MRYSTLLLRNCFPLFLVLAASCNTMLVSGHEKRSVPRQTSRNRNTVRNPERLVALSSDEKRRGRRVSASRRTNKEEEDQQLQRRVATADRRQRTRGLTGTRKSQRRLGGKDGGKNGGSGGGSSGGGSSGGGSGSSGSESGGSGTGGGSDAPRSGLGWDEYGEWCGCLCADQDDLYYRYSSLGFSSDMDPCEYSIHPDYYGEGITDPEPVNSETDQMEYYQFNRVWKWATIEQDEDDYFTNGGQWDVEGRNDDSNGGDDGQYQAQAETVVVQQADDEYSPYAAFDIGQCDTYSHLWTNDLFLSCSAGKQYCQCTYMEELIGMGLLSCTDISKCPQECPVCSSCLESYCDQFRMSSLVSSQIQSPLGGWTIAAVLSTVVLAAWVTHKRKRDSPKGGVLGESLMDANGVPYAKRDWKVRIGSNGLPTEEKTKKKTQVWLAPDMSTIQNNKPLFPDVLEKDENNEAGAKRKKKQKKRYNGPVIVTSSHISVDSSLSSMNGANNDNSEDSDVGDI